MFDKFTDRSKQVIIFAHRQAKALGHDTIYPEHILLGLLMDELGVAKNVLTASFGLCFKKVLKKVRKMIKPIGERAETDNLPISYFAKKTLEFACEEAKALFHNHIGTEHLLLGLLRAEEEKTKINAGIFEVFKIKHADVRKKVFFMLDLEDPANKDKGKHGFASHERFVSTYMKCLDSARAIAKDILKTDPILREETLGMLVALAGVLITERKPKNKHEIMQILKKIGKNNPDEAILVAIEAAKNLKDIDFIMKAKEIAELVGSRGNKAQSARMLAEIAQATAELDQQIPQI